MLVVDVWTLGVPSASRLSAGRPLSGSVIATSDAHVCAAYPRSVDRSEGLRPLPAAAADPADARARTTARSGAARRADIGQPRAGGGSETGRSALEAGRGDPLGDPPLHEHE